jgi:hypothetical protein
LTVVAMVMLAQFPGSRWIAILLSQNGHPEPPETVAADKRAAEGPRPTPSTRA